jgi:hypothetical protein
LAERSRVRIPRGHPRSFAGRGRTCGAQYFANKVLSLNVILNGAFLAEWCNFRVARIPDDQPRSFVGRKNTGLLRMT